jgi:hypothetical protein
MFLCLVKYSPYCLEFQLKVAGLDEICILSCTNFVLEAGNVLFELHVKWELYWTDTNRC